MADDTNELKTQIRDLKKRLKVAQENEQKEIIKGINTARDLKELQLQTNEKADPKLRNLVWFIDQFLYVLSSYDQLNKDTFRSTINAFSYMAWAYLTEGDDTNDCRPSLISDNEELK